MMRLAMHQGWLTWVPFRALRGDEGRAAFTGRGRGAVKLRQLWLIRGEVNMSFRRYWLMGKAVGSFPFTLQ